MRIAVAFTPPREDAAPGLPDDATVFLLPLPDGAAEPIGAALGFSGADPADVLVLGSPLLLGQGAWDALGPRARMLDGQSDDVIEGAIAEGASALDGGAVTDAHRAYERAEAMLAFENGPRRAEVLTCLAEIELRFGRAREAIALLDRALSIFPAHRGALQMRVDLARANVDAATAASLRRRMLAFCETDEERLATLRAVTEDALAAAAEAIEQARPLRPGSITLLERLRAVKEAAFDWLGAVNVAVAIAEATPDPKARARAFVEAARLCARRADNVDRAVALYEAAIADDPAVEGAFEAIEEVLLASGDHPGVERAYVRQLERLADVAAVEAELALLAKLAELRETKLHDRRGAIAALDAIVTKRPTDVGARTRLAALLEAGGEDELAARCLEIAAEHAPTRVATYRALSRIVGRAGDQDRAFAASAALVHLGEAELDEQLTYQQFAPETTLAATRALDPAAWEMLAPPELDTDLAEAVRAIAPAAVALRVEQLRAAKKLVVLDPAVRQDPEKTTVTAVRTAAWAARLLGFPAPEVYVLKDTPGGLGRPATGTHALLLGRGVLSGRTVPELSFAAARELALAFVTGDLLTYFPAKEEQRAVLVAGVALALPALATTADIASARDAIGARMSPEARATLDAAVARLGQRGLTLDMTRFLRAAEVLACRAGLLASGDVNAAGRMLAVDGRAVGGLSGAERTRGLVAFSISCRYAGLRASLGISVRPSSRSSRPPPPSVRA